MAFDPEFLLRQEQETETKIQSFMRIYERFLRTQLGKISRDVTNKKTKIEIIKTLNNIEEVLYANGLEDQLNELTTLYGSELKKIRKEFEKLGVDVNKAKYSAADIDTLTAIVDFDKGVIESNTIMRAKEYKAAVLRAAIVGDISSIAEKEAYVADRAVHVVETEIRTGLSGFNQTVRNIRAETFDIELFVYLGPEDNKTRDFCRDLIERGRVFTKKQILKMDNGQGLDVMTYKGGYNCRHGWYSITADDAKRQYGYNQ